MGKFGKRAIQPILVYLQTNPLAVTNTRTDGNKLFVTSSQNLRNQRFTLDGTEYMFSVRNEEYEIRKLSSTNNANVIFSVVYRPQKSGISDTEIIALLQ